MLIELEMRSENSSRPLLCSRPRALPQSDTSQPRSGSPSPPDRREASVHPEPARRNWAAPAPEPIADDREPRDTRGNFVERRTCKHGDGVARGYHVHRGGCYDSSEDRSPSPEPPGPRVFSKAIREIILPARFRPPTTLTKYNGETKPKLWLADFRLACQLGGATDDRVIIRQLSLFLSDTARA
jgi:hypothetical protein